MSVFGHFGLISGQHWVNNWLQPIPKIASRPAPFTKISMTVARPPSTDTTCIFRLLLLFEPKTYQPVSTTSGVRGVGIVAMSAKVPAADKGGQKGLGIGPAGGTPRELKRTCCAHKIITPTHIGKHEQHRAATPEISCCGYSRFVISVWWAR